jgi:hypothetical protein
MGGVSALAAAIIVAELNLSISGVAAYPADGQADAVSTPSSADQTKDDLNGFVTEILAHPVFTPTRNPPPKPEALANYEPPPVVKEPPELRSRLTGVMVGPNDRREALFDRNGEKPLAVRVGEDVDGWTVSSIDSAQVVLKSEFGERIVVPTFDAAGANVPRARQTVPAQPANTDSVAEESVVSPSANKAPDRARKTPLANTAVTGRQTVVLPATRRRRDIN